MTVTLYSSTEVGAPALNNAAGSLKALLSACLVTGFAPKAVTSITRAGIVATVTTAANHELTSGWTETIQGAVEAEYNGSHIVTVLSATAYSFNIATTPASPATGTIFSTKVGAGWTMPFEGVNTAAYKQPIGSNGLYCYVDDSTVVTSRIRGFEAMISIGVGTGPFPTDTQVSGGLYVYKSADATAKPWILVTNGKIFHLIVDVSNNATSCAGTCFGDVVSLKAGDIYNTILIAGATAAATASAYAALVSGGFTSITGSHYLARSYTQIGSSSVAGKTTDSSKAGNASTMGNGGMVYPNPADNGLYLAPVFVHEVSALRGLFPGAWCPCHSKPLSHGDTFSGSGALAGKTFLVQNVTPNGQVFLETSDTWS